MKTTKLLLALATATTLLFTSCEKTEILQIDSQIETSYGQKNLSVLEQNNWELIDFKCAPKNLNLIWTNGPRMSFSGDMITTSFNNLSCGKNYDKRSNILMVKGANCNLGDINVEAMLDLFQGDFTWSVLPNGNLEIKNNNRTRLVLKPISSTISNANTSVQ